MSLNISNTLLRVATVTMTFSLNHLTVKQHNSLNKMVRTGVVKGFGVPATIAVTVLEDKELPYVHYTSQWVSFNKVPLDPKHPLRGLLILAHAASKLDNAYVDIPHWKRHLPPQYSYTKSVRELESDVHLHLNSDAIRITFKDAKDIHHDVTLGEEIITVVSTPENIQEYL